jgi:hypothetical protein
MLRVFITAAIVLFPFSVQSEQKDPYSEALERALSGAKELWSPPAECGVGLEETTITCVSGPGGFLPVSCKCIKMKNRCPYNILAFYSLSTNSQTQSAHIPSNKSEERCVTGYGETIRYLRHQRVEY